MAEKEEEDSVEIELSLGLSLNGRFGVDPNFKKLVRSSSSISNFETTRLTVPLTRTCSLPVETDEESRKRKEIQMLRRMEVKRKRSEKHRIPPAPATATATARGENCEERMMIKENSTNPVHGSPKPGGLVHGFEPKNPQVENGLLNKGGSQNSRNSVNGAPKPGGLVHGFEPKKPHMEIGLLSNGGSQNSNNSVNGVPKPGGLVHGFEPKKPHMENGLLSSGGSQNSTNSVNGAPKPGGLVHGFDPKKPHVENGLSNGGSQNSTNLVNGAPKPSGLVHGFEPKPHVENGLLSNGGSQGSSGSSGISELESLTHSPAMNKSTEAKSSAKTTNDVTVNSEAKPLRSRSGSVTMLGSSEMVRDVLADMPCVSTKGLGPNGKRIEGFLYRYRKGAEVRIVCVCHGSFLTPADFVKHAGGGDVEHPLRHIIVNPSPLL